MAKKLELSGKKFGRLTVVGLSHSVNGKTYWDVACECGEKRTILGASIKSGNTKSCGCLTEPHGKYGSPTHRSWASMKARCLNPNNDFFENYGGRGITVCERWMKFSNFMADMGERPDGTSIERIDNNKGYQSDNCKWATREEQQNNTTRNRYLEFNGNRLTLAQWARKTGIDTSTLQVRLKLNWPIEKC